MSKPNIREIAEKELRFHEALAAECEQAGTEFARGRACGITELVSDIRKVLAADWLRLTASRCEVYLGGYQPVPIRCALDVHTGQHAGIGENGATVIWPEISAKHECEWCVAGYEIDGAYLTPGMPIHVLEDREVPCMQDGPEVAELRMHVVDREYRLAATESRLSYTEWQLETLGARVEQQGREIAKLRNTLDHIASSEVMGIKYARRIASHALTHVTCPDCDGAGVLNAGPGGHDHCDRCGTTGRVRR